MYQYKSTLTTVILLFIFSFRGTSWKITISSIYCRAQWMFVVKTGKLSRYFIYSNFSTNMLVHFYPKNLQSL